jgi:surfactin synthase thioesterase subunit
MTADVEVVVAFPGAGGSAGMFDGLRAGLRPAELVVPDTPGRGRRTRSPVKTYQELASELCTDLERRLAGRPYTMFAVCVGTLVAYELLREQRRRCLPAPERLVVCGRGAPDRGGFLEEYVDWTDDQLDEYLGASLPDSYDWERLPLALRQVIRVRLRRDIELASNYRYDEQPPLRVPLHALRGADGDPTTEEDVRSWRRHTSHDFEARTVPGGAYFYLDDPAVAMADRE